jgi:hypothetical protein
MISATSGALPHVGAAADVNGRLTMQGFENGVAYWRIGTRWPADFHNAFYEELAEQHPHANFDLAWWRTFLAASGGLLATITSPGLRCTGTVKKEPLAASRTSTITTPPPVTTTHPNPRDSFERAAAAVRVLSKADTRPAISTTRRSIPRSTGHMQRIQVLRAGSLHHLLSHVDRPPPHPDTNQQVGDGPVA